MEKRPLHLYFGKLNYLSFSIHSIYYLIDIQTVIEQLVCVFKRLSPFNIIFWKGSYVSVNSNFY